MKNTTQQIIKESKERGFIPEKREYGQLYNYSGGREDNHTVDVHNQAIDSFNLEKIIKLAYERGKIDEVMLFMETMQERANKIRPNLLLNEIVNYAFDRKKEILTNLPNKQ